MALRADYESQVLAVREVYQRMDAEGQSEEAIARELHARRRALASRFKDATPEPLRAWS